MFDEAAPHFCGFCTEKSLKNWLRSHPAGQLCSMERQPLQTGLFLLIMVAGKSVTYPG